MTDEIGSRDDAQARWALVLPYREHMLAVARRRCSNDEDAEDCVQEAMLRVAQFETLDAARVAAMLTSVTVRLAVDMHRHRVRARRYLPRLVSVTAQQEETDERILDRGEASWLAAQLHHLPDREREVLRERVAGYSPAEAAARLSLSHKSVESAFTRARGRMRGWAGAGALLVAEYLRRLRQRPAAFWAAVAAASAGCLVLSSVPQIEVRPGHGPDGLAVIAPPVWFQGAAAAARAPLSSASRAGAAAAAPAHLAAQPAAEAKPTAAGPASPQEPPIARTMIGGPGGAMSITVVGYAPPGRFHDTAYCLEEVEFVHADGSVSCPR